MNRRHAQQGESIGRDIEGILCICVYQGVL